MPRRSSEKIKKPKVSKKLSSPRSKKTPRPTGRAASKESAVLLSTDMSGDSIAHGHAPYHHNLVDKPVKKLDERSQRLIMYIGISLIMVVIVIFWIMNLKHIMGPDAFSITASSSVNSKTKSDFDNLKSDLTKTLSEVKGEIKNLEDLSKQIPTSTASPALISGTVTPATTTETVKPALPQTLPN